MQRPYGSRLVPDHTNPRRRNELLTSSEVRRRDDSAPRGTRRRRKREVVDNRPANHSAISAAIKAFESRGLSAIARR